MKYPPSKIALLCGLMGALMPQPLLSDNAASSEAERRAAPAIQFSRDILPLLSDRCFHCHGPDAETRQAGFRLDKRESAIGEADSGEHPIVPGKPETSELLRRIMAEDPDERMPPAGSGKARLTPQETTRLRNWISQGAKYEAHWAFVPPRSTSPPTVKNQNWPQNAIDHFVLTRLEQEGLPPSPPVDRATLLRRVTFDLTGLPPTPEELDAFERDTSADAYDKVVDRLLQSPRFGEHLARVWLDAARYADTNGYLQNPYRVSWPWRDWLVRALNDNKPYDRFIAELLAGDLLPEANEQTRLATFFLRLHMITSEGGSLDEEFRVEYAADRAETVSSVLMGLTVGCCRCHDHKFDPLKQREYFQLFAMLADPKGEDPVKDHSHDPAFAPLLRLSKDQYREEAARLVEAIATAQSHGNQDSKLRLTLQMRMLDQGLPVMVMEENPKPRQNFVLTRGAYDAPDKKQPVERGSIDSVFAWKGDLQRDRLGLARWLTDPAHPLTARVEVNRIWQSFFGRGLVETQENFGLQGSFPTHPELLDTLAVGFRQRGWDRKALIRQMVTSATYQQSSAVSARHKEVDPTNRLLGRMSRRRLPAEAVRDQALFVAGLLKERVGGHPVLPYQPDGLWTEGANNPGYGKGSIIQTGVYERSSGNELYRRSLYTFWNRNAPPPQMLLFDAPERSFAVVARSTTNTPLQALVTTNDVQFVEAARFLAERTLRDTSAADDAARLSQIYRRCTGRRLQPPDRQALMSGLKTWRERYRTEPEAAVTLLTRSGEKPSQPGLDPVEHAAWMLLASAILNLDATLVVD